MQIVIAPDSFKECLPATRVAEAISKGILRVMPEARIISIPVADGGEGTVDALVKATQGKIIPAPSVDALNRPISSFYGVLGDGQTAVVEMAAASGIELLAPEERNPMLTSTYGTGLLIRAALESGYTKIVVAIGGSATNDGGAGMAQALGMKFYDADNKPLPLGGGFLSRLHSIDMSEMHPLISRAQITVACDVRNPLLGPTGATYTFGPQKGATPEMLVTLEDGMQHYAAILQNKFNQDISTRTGAGAAGGLGAGLMAFCQARMIPGFEMVSGLTHLEEHISQAHLVFTGEGKIDHQSAFGKTISGVARLALQHKKPAIALAGIIKDDLTELYRQGITAAFSIANGPMSLEESKAQAFGLLADRTEQILRIINKMAPPLFGFSTSNK
jgi:glycerate kinase